MQFTPESAAYLGTCAGLAFSIASYAMAAGVARANLDNVLKRQDEMELKFDKLDERFVPFRHFEAITKHVEESLKRIEINVSKLTNFILSEHARRNSTGIKSDGSESSD